MWSCACINYIPAFAAVATSSQQSREWETFNEEIGVRGTGIGPLVAVLKGLLPAHQIWQSSSAERCITVTVTVTSPQSACFLAPRTRYQPSSSLAASSSNFLLPDPWPFSEDAGRWTSATYLGRALLTEHHALCIDIKNKSLPPFFHPLFLSSPFLPRFEDVDFTDRAIIQLFFYFVFSFVCTLNIA